MVGVPFLPRTWEEYYYSAPSPVYHFIVSLYWPGLNLTARDHPENSPLQRHFCRLIRNFIIGYLSNIIPIIPKELQILDVLDPNLLYGM